MLYYIYSIKYGWNPLHFLLKGKNFYKERRKWVIRAVQEEYQKSILTHTCAPIG